MRRILATLALLVATTSLHAQHTFGVTGGYGSGSESIYPDVEARGVYGLVNAGVSWRSYTAEKVVGCFGIDLQYMQRGFSYAPNASTAADGAELFYYTRTINSLVMPIVWQPHVYMFDRRVRLFFEAAATFSYDMSSTYENEYQQNQDGAESSEGYAGTYHYLTARDNRFGYGLAGGGGLALLFGKFEILGRVWYYIGLSDVVRNRNKYYTNNLDGNENPFSLTPIRSSLNNLSISFGVNYHFGPEGFKSWNTKRTEKVKMGSDFNYKGKK